MRPASSAGETPTGTILGAGTGDNAAAALGVAAGAGDVVVSIGTSGVVAAVSDVPAADSTGTVAGFADATGRFLPLVCTLNAARVLDAAARVLGVDHSELSRLALSGATRRERPGRCPRISRVSGRPTGRTQRVPCTGSRSDPRRRRIRARRRGGPALRARRRAGRAARAGRPRRPRRGSSAAQGPRRCAESRRRCSAVPLPLRTPASTSRTALPDRPPGCCRARRNPHDGRPAAARSSKPDLPPR